jgi:hypothetical protein
MSTASLARPSLPLVAMIKVVAGKHDNNAEDQESHLVRRRHDVVGELVEAVEAGTMSLESWLRPSKLARKIATSSTLYKITL